LNSPELLVSSAAKPPVTPAFTDRHLLDDCIWLKVAETKKSLPAEDTTLFGRGER
jgi:hypothetical protein